MPAHGSLDGGEHEAGGAAAALRRLYRRMYDFLCGVHPRVYLWHAQFLSSRALVLSMRRALAYVPDGCRVLDVGCGTAPYRRWLPRRVDYTGIDIAAGGGAPDIVIEPDSAWPLADGAYDLVLCTQVLEHARDKDLLLAEIKRVLRPGGLLILSVPFVYGEHGLPHDYRRFTRAGLREALESDYVPAEQFVSGRAGTVLVTLFLNWADEALGARRATRVLKPLLLPFWLGVCLFCNVAGFLLDKIDPTTSLYLDNIYIGRKGPARGVINR